MKQTISTNEAAQILAQDENSTFSYKGALALCEWLNSTNFDAVALRCDFSEWESAIEWAKEYFTDYTKEFDMELDEDDLEENIQDFIMDHGIVIPFNGGIITSNFWVVHVLSMTWNCSLAFKNWNRMASWRNW